MPDCLDTAMSIGPCATEPISVKSFAGLYESFRYIAGEIVFVVVTSMTL